MNLPIPMYQLLSMVFVLPLYPTCIIEVFSKKGLANLVKLLNNQHADALLIGGDLHEGCEYVQPLLAALSGVKTPMGTYVVLGNNDYEACYDDIVRGLQKYGMHLLEHKVDTLRPMILSFC